MSMHVCRFISLIFFNKHTLKREYIKIESLFFSFLFIHNMTHALTNTNNNNNNINKN